MKYPSSFNIRHYNRIFTTHIRSNAEANVINNSSTIYKCHSVYESFKYHPFDAGDCYVHYYKTKSCIMISLSVSTHQVNWILSLLIKTFLCKDFRTLSCDCTSFYPKKYSVKLINFIYAWGLCIPNISEIFAIMTVFLRIGLLKQSMFELFGRHPSSSFVIVDWLLCKLWWICHHKYLTSLNLLIKNWNLLLCTLRSSRRATCAQIRDELVLFSTSSSRFINIFVSFY